MDGHGLEAERNVRSVVSVEMPPQPHVSALGALLLLTAVVRSANLLQMCGGRTEAGVFQVVSPGYPDTYPPGLRCEVTLEASSASVCSLDLDIGTLSLPCPSDRLTVADMPLCGSSHHQVPFIQPRTTLTFRGSIEGGEGFNITVRQMECNRSKTKSLCGGEFSGKQIQISSPGYPSPYPEELDCRYTIRASDPDVCQVEVRLYDSSLEESESCRKDSLQINEDRFCGNLGGVRTYDINKTLNITFTSDLEGSGKGFNLTVRQIRCVDASPVRMNEHLATDKQDSSVDCAPGALSSLSRNGYPMFSSQNYQFYSRPVDNFIQPGYLPPYSNQGPQRVPMDQTPPRAPLFGQQLTSTLYSNLPYQSNFIQAQHRPVQNFGPPIYRTPTYQQPQFSTHYQQHFMFNTNLNNRPNSPSYWPTQTDIRQTSSQYQQCCNQVYEDSHFLLVSPGFPRSTTTDCIYTISRYSTLTYQIRYQLRYFWTGEDLGTGCSGGYLEIDGSKVCGCKTGASWTSQFTESETSKTLHLKLDTTFNRLFNGFVIEVYQDDSYSQRYQRASDSKGELIANVTESGGPRESNLSQYVETFIEREPVFPTSDGYPVLERTSSQQVWDSSRQAWSLPTDWFCLRWNLQDWLVLAREVLWVKYQCPASTSTLRSDVSQPADLCRTCLYLCRQNCQCCQ